MRLTRLLPLLVAIVAFDGLAAFDSNEALRSREDSDADLRNSKLQSSRMKDRRAKTLGSERLQSSKASSSKLSRSARARAASALPPARSSASSVERARAELDYDR